MHPIHTIYYALDFSNRLVMLYNVSDERNTRTRVTHKSKNENWLGLLPYSYTNRLAR